MVFPPRIEMRCDAQSPGAILVCIVEPFCAASNTKRSSGPDSARWLHCVNFGHAGTGAGQVPGAELHEKTGLVEFLKSL